MKKHHLLFVIIVSIITTSCAQEKFTLKSPDVAALKKELIDSNYQVNTVLRYFEKNYKATSEKIDIKLDPDFDNAECGFTKKFEYGIVYTYYNCGEATPVKEEITLPKTPYSVLKKWVELTYKANGTEIENTWYSSTEYGPHDKEAGCYYTIKQGEKNTIISTWCGS